MNPFAEIPNQNDTCPNEGFPERDIWSLGTLDQVSARCPELLGRRRRRHLEIQVDIQARELFLKVLWCDGPRAFPNGESCWDATAAVTWMTRELYGEQVD